MMGTVRFLTGLAMVVVGVALASPFFVRLAEVSTAAGDAASVAGGGTLGQAWVQAPGVSPAPSGAGAFCIPDTLPSAVSAAPMPAPGPVDAPVQAIQAVPEAPAIPDALPVPPADLSLAPPAVAPTYRSTLDVPPPPLLDVDAASPLAMAGPAVDQGMAAADAPVGTGAGVVRTISASTGQANVRPAWHAAASAGTQPASDGRSAATYVVRDGDDLTNIASRLYGHPGAAAAIWNANRDRLADPAVLPIGVALRLPAQWAPATSRPVAGPPTVEPARRPGSVRVGPGETLESLAQRFYGDKAWAPRLWEANRDRLRSPALLVAGMELRLP